MNLFRASSTRIVASIWWFFTLIMVSSYTANLAAFLTYEKPDPILKSHNDLLANPLSPKVKAVAFGAKGTGSTIEFFKDVTTTEDSYKKQLYNKMIEHKDWLVSSTEAGVEKAAAGKYAFFVESSMVEYYIERECRLEQVGGLLDEKGYGIAMKKGSPYRAALSEQVMT